MKLLSEFMALPVPCRALTAEEWQARIHNDSEWREKKKMIFRYAMKRTNNEFWTKALSEHLRETILIEISTVHTRFPSNNFNYDDLIKFRTEFRALFSDRFLVSRHRKWAICAKLPDITAEKVIVKSRLMINF